MLHNPLPMTGSRPARGGRRNPSVTDEAIDKIQALIISGSWGPGDRLPKEKELAAQLGLSRNSLLEAVRALSQLRVLELLLESTSFVSHLLVGESALELFEVRRLLDGSAAALAAARIDKAGKEELGERLQQMVESRTVEELVEADVAFHAVIARATGNTFLTSLLASLSSRTLRARMWRAREVDNAFDVTRDEHRRIFESVISGDPELARAAAMAHIASGERWLRAQLATSAEESQPAPAEVGA